MLKFLNSCLVSFVNGILLALIAIMSMYIYEYKHEKDVFNRITGINTRVTLDNQMVIININSYYYDVATIKLDSTDNIASVVMWAKIHEYTPENTPALINIMFKYIGDNVFYAKYETDTNGIITKVIMCPECYN